MDVYTPKSSRHHHTDGAYFGTGFPHMLFMVHPEYRPKRPANQFVPRLYGFKIHHLAYQIQQQAAATPSASIIIFESKFFTIHHFTPRFMIALMPITTPPTIWNRITQKENLQSFPFVSKSALLSPCTE